MRVRTPHLILVRPANALFLLVHCWEKAKHYFAPAYIRYRDEINGPGLRTIYTEKVGFAYVGPPTFEVVIMRAGRGESNCAAVSFQPTSFALYASEDPVLLDHEIVPLVVAEGQKHRSSSPDERGEDLGLSDLTYRLGVHPESLARRRRIEGRTRVEDE